jgi:hypothetical protein
MVHTVGVGNGESRNPDSRNSRIGSTTGPDASESVRHTAGSHGYGHGVAEAVGAIG